MNTLKILYVIPNLLKGGAERLVLDICNELQKKENVRIKLVIFEDKNDYQFLSKHIDIEVCRITFKISIFKKNHIDLSQFESILDKFKPDIIHSHLYAAEIVSREKIRNNIKYFSHCHDNVVQFNKLRFSTFFSKSKITNYYERMRLFKKYKLVKNQFVAISKDTLHFLKNNLPINFLNQIHLLTNAVNVQSFHKPNFKLPDTEIKLINVGSLVDKKNQQFLIKVVKYLKDSGYKVHLNLIGDGVNKIALINQIKSLELNNEVSMLGIIDEVQKELWASDVYVHSATYEPFGLVLIEAMAAGLPVVCLNGQGNTEIIDSDKNGILVKENNPKVFAEKILEIVLDANRYKMMSDFAKEYSQKYAIDLYVDKLLNLYGYNSITKQN